MSAASAKIKEYLKQYQTSDKWVDPNTGNKLPAEQRGITQTNINGSGAGGQSYKYTLVEDTRENGYSYLLILFKVSKEAKDDLASDPPWGVVYKVHKQHSGPEVFTSTKAGIDFANAKRKEAAKKLKKTQTTHLTIQPDPQADTTQRIQQIHLQTLQSKKAQRVSLCLDSTLPRGGLALRISMHN